MIGVAGITTLYLPFYMADYAKLKELREEREGKGGGSRGSVWKNIDK